eukprot:CAMPEP_0197523648 /NCGR_PEP_ID=MMETSP1318-20131121/8537_1 /TAXON_ID=552666 /ORGANISM="Partenskyella glossopodia, Strain RCC365" /LENGTH=189 /DNA_ID=CAMNT_0043076405 /DNA_START=142 /DNA_END=711 /DNA_ORIENTATION=+
MDGSEQSRRRNMLTAAASAAMVVAVVCVCGMLYGGSATNQLGMKISSPTVTQTFRMPTSMVSPVATSESAVNMRHRKGFKRLGRPQDQRKALIRGLVTEVLRHGRITTTTVRAKAIRRYVDKMIGLAKRGDLHARRQAYGFIYDKDLVKNLFIEVPKRYADRPGGYTRVKKELLPRRGDNAELSYIELV